MLNGIYEGNGFLPNDIKLISMIIVIMNNNMNKKREKINA